MLHATLNPVISLPHPPFFRDKDLLNQVPTGHRDAKGAGKLSACPNLFFQPLLITALQNCFYRVRSPASDQLTRQVHPGTRSDLFGLHGLYN